MRRPVCAQRFARFVAATLCLAAATGLPRDAHAIDITWINPAGGAYIDPVNWSPAQVPDFEDRALITLAGTYTVTVGSIDRLYATELVLGGASGEQTLHLMPAGSLDISGAMTIGARAVVVLDQESYLSAFGFADVAGRVQAVKATFDGSEGIHNTGSFDLTDTSPSGRFLNDGFVRTQGTCSFGTLENARAGTLEALTGTGLFPGTFMDSLINHGHVTAGPSTQFVAGSLMSNEPGGVFSLEASSTANSNEFRNAGVWRVAAGSHCDGALFRQLASGELVPHYAPGNAVYPFLVPDAVLDGMLSPVFSPAFTPPPGNLPLIFKQTLDGQFAIVSPSGTHGVAVDAAYLDQVYVRVLGPGIVITPPAGADDGPVSAIISGSDLSVVTQARLTRAGQTSIAADPVTFDKATNSVYATFDLTGRAQGAWNVEVEGPGGTQSAPNLFTIGVGGTYHQPIRVEILGRSVLRVGGSSEWALAINNPNGTDERGAVQFELPPGLRWELIAPFPGDAKLRRLAGETGAGMQLVVRDVLAPPGLTMSAIRLRLARPAGSSLGQGTLQARWYTP